MNYGSGSLTGQLKNKKKTKLLIIVILAILAIIAVVFFFINKDKNELSNKENVFNIEEVYVISGRGTVVQGNMQKGKIKVGDKVQIIGLDSEVLTTEIMAIEKSGGKILDEAIVGDTVAILLKDITRDQVKTGQVLASSNK